MLLFFVYLNLLYTVIVKSNAYHYTYTETYVLLLHRGWLRTYTYILLVGYVILILYRYYPFRKGAPRVVYVVRNTYRGRVASGWFTFCQYTCI